MFERGGKTFCDSLQVAETFEKRHDNVLMTLEGETRDGVHKNGLLDELAQSPVFTGDYFIKDSHKDARGRRQPRYLMSRDGFTLLVMGFTGEKALRFKLDYINRFNQMEAFIQSLLTTKLEFPAFTEAIMLSQWNFA